MLNEQSTRILKRIVSANHKLVNFNIGLIKLGLSSGDTPINYSLDELMFCAAEILGIDMHDIDIDNRFTTLFLNGELTEEEMFNQVINFKVINESEVKNVPSNI